VTGHSLNVCQMVFSCLSGKFLTRISELDLMPLFKSLVQETDPQHRQTRGAEALKGYFTSGKMNVYLKWVIYVEEM